MAGGDIAFFDQLLKEGGNTDAQISELFEDVHGIVRTLRSMPQPVVAAVQGACAGFGVSLMAACDLGHRDGRQHIHFGVLSSRCESRRR